MGLLTYLRVAVATLRLTAGFALVSTPVGDAISLRYFLVIFLQAVCAFVMFCKARANEHTLYVIERTTPARHEKSHNAPQKMYVIERATQQGMRKAIMRRKNQLRSVAVQRVSPGGIIQTMLPFSGLPLTEPYHCSMPEFCGRENAAHSALQLVTIKSRLVSLSKTENIQPRPTGSIMGETPFFTANPAMMRSS